MKLMPLAGAALLAAFSTVAAAVGGLTDLSVYDRTESRPLQVYWHAGRAYVVGKPGNEYQVSLRSRAGDEVLAVVSVDGVNVVTGETAAPQQSGYVLSPRGTLDIQGWRKNLSETAAFYFTALPDSYAARTGRPDNVGVIGMALFRRKAQEPAPISQPSPVPFARRDARPSAAEAPAAENAMGRSADAQLGTGHGRRETSYAQHVQFERATSSPAEIVTLYYDSYRNLLARGVIRRPVPYPPSPRPFPGFVPDPFG